MIDHFQGRLASLARTQVIVSNTTAGTVDLENLIHDELLSVGVGDGPQASLTGPDVALAPKTAEVLCLALHEFTTNALKYGVLRTEEGRLEIAWSVEEETGAGRTLEFSWNEEGVPAVSAPPPHEGFGRELIEKALPYQLGAQTSFEFHAGGIRCRIRLPLGREGGPVGLSQE